MRKITLTLLAAGAALAIAGCNREEPAEEANTAVAEDTMVPPSESADNLDAAATNLDNAAENMDASASNAADNATAENTTNAM